MSAAPDVYAGPAFLGWRSWRILPFERLGEPPSLRLCASGRHGLPKVWHPREAMRAVCGKFNTVHDAPWIDCECGFHAYRERDRAEDHLMSFAAHNGRVVAWAFGQVSLWGRIVEHADGWRAEYAYPYALTVFADREIAAKLRGLYGVDVDVLPADQLPHFEDDEDETDDPSGGITARLRNVTRQVEKLQAAFAPPARAPRVPRWVSEAIGRQPDGRYRSGEEELDFVMRELNQVSWLDGAGPVAASHLAATMMSRLGAENYQPTAGDVSELGAILYKLAMRREARRLRGPGGVNCWAMHWGDVPDGYVEQDPTLDHLERDVAMVVALARASNADEEATAKNIVAELSTSLGEKQESRRWSGSFVRCQVRGWMENVSPCTYRATEYGCSVAHLGHDLPEWPFLDDESAAETVLQALRNAVDEQGGAVTCGAVARRFRARWRTFPSGVTVGQRLLALKRRGLVESERRRGSTLVHWRPSVLGGDDAS